MHNKSTVFEVIKFEPTSSVHHRLAWIIGYIWNVSLKRTKIKHKQMYNMKTYQLYLKLCRKIKNYVWKHVYIINEMIMLTYAKQQQVT